MADNANLIAEATLRIFKERGDPAQFKKNGQRRQLLWQALEESGVTLAWVDASRNGAGATLADGFEVLQIAGEFAIDVPLAETLLAGWLLDKAQMSVPSGVLSAGPVDLRDRIEIAFRKRLTGSLRSLAFAREASHLVVAVPRGENMQIALVNRADAEIAEARNLAGDARDTVTLRSVTPVAVGDAPLSTGQILMMGAAIRATLMAGAMQAILDLSVKYANERVAFEKPIAKFQAIQHSLAKLAAETAAALAAAGSAANSIQSAPEFDAGVFLEVASAKIRVGEAASVAAAIAHQVHGAIGFSEEHVLHRFTQRLLAWRDDFGGESYWALELGSYVAARGASALWPTLTER